MTGKHSNGIKKKDQIDKEIENEARKVKFVIIQELYE